MNKVRLDEIFVQKKIDTAVDVHLWKVITGICMYYPLSIGLTFFQKWFLKSYKLPLVVVTGHYACKLLLAVVIRWCMELHTGTKRARVPFKDQLQWLVPIGICASLDIGLSNWGLEYVTVSLYTMAKSGSILFIAAFALLLHLERWRKTLIISATSIAFGLFLFTYRSSQFDLRGFMLIELAAACTGLRWTVSQIVMQDEEHALKHPLDMVAHVQPWMIVAILPMIFSIEGPELTVAALMSYHDVFAPLHIMLFVSFGGLLAFAMEMAEYLLLVHTSGITLNIFGMIKEVATLLLAHFINGDRLTLINICGLLLCLFGVFLHGASRKRTQSNRTTSPAVDQWSLLSDIDL